MKYLDFPLLPASTCPSTKVTQRTTQGIRDEKMPRDPGRPSVEAPAGSSLLWEESREGSSSQLREHTGPAKEVLTRTSPEASAYLSTGKRGPSVCCLPPVFAPSRASGTRGVVVEPAGRGQVGPRGNTGHCSDSEEASATCGVTAPGTSVGPVQNTGKGTRG